MNDRHIAGPAAEDVTRIENEKLCGELLNWRKLMDADAGSTALWADGRGNALATPTFKDLVDSVLIDARLLDLGFTITTGSEADGRRFVRAANDARTLYQHSYRLKWPELMRLVGLMVIDQVQPRPE